MKFNARGKDIVCGEIVIKAVGVKGDNLKDYQYPDGTKYQQRNFIGWALPFGMITASQEVAVGTARMLHKIAFRNKSVPNVGLAIPE